MSDSEYHVDHAYTDRQGARYEFLVPLYFKEGDVVLLSTVSVHRETGTAFRTSKATLASVSPVFRDMFHSTSSAANEIHLDVGPRIIENFLALIVYGRVPGVWSHTLDLLEFTKKYECEDLIQRLLDGASLQEPGEERFDAFVAVCEANHLVAACRLLRQGGAGERGNAMGKSLRPNSKAWTPRDAERLSARWLWALTCGVQWAEGILAKPDGWVDRTRDDYWIAVVGEFMSRITMCESSVTRPKSSECHG